MAFSTLLSLLRRAKRGLLMDAWFGLGAYVPLIRCLWRIHSCQCQALNRNLVYDIEGNSAAAVQDAAMIRYTAEKLEKLNRTSFYEDEYQRKKPKFKRALVTSASI